MRKICRIFLWITCLWLWTNATAAQPTEFLKWGGDYGLIAVYDTVGFPKYMKVAADSLARTDGIILDLRQLPKDKIWSMSIWTSLQKELEDYTKPFVILMGEEIHQDQPLYHWMKERYWSRFEPSGSLGKAEAKIRTLYSRHLKEGQERMDWLMQQGKTK